MAIHWMLTSIDQYPSDDLAEWKAIEVTLPRYPWPTLHLLGYAALADEGRVTSPVIEFDASKMLATTRSGRVYKLCGNPGADPDAHYVLTRWLDFHRIEGYRDATSELWQAHVRSRTG